MDGRSLRLFGGLALTVVGAGLTAVLPMIGAILLGAGLTMVRQYGSWLPAIIALIAISAPFAAADISLGIRVAATGSSIAALIYVLEKDISWGLVIALVLATGAAFLGADVLSAYLAGTNLPVLLETSFEDSLSMLEGLPSSQEFADLADELLVWFTRLLPSFYVFQALGILFGGFVGALFVRRDRAVKYGQRFLTFDAPMAFVAVLVAGILMTGISFLDTPASVMLATIGLNFMISVRVVFAVQGFAVIFTKLIGARVSFLIWILVLFITIQIEVFTLAISLLGLVDIWVNIRKLPRLELGHEEAEIEHKK